MVLSNAERLPACDILGSQLVILIPEQRACGGYFVSSWVLQMPLSGVSLISATAAITSVEQVNASIPCSTISGWMMNIFQFSLVEKRSNASEVGRGKSDKVRERH